MVDGSIKDSSSDVPTIDLENIIKMYLGSMKIASGLAESELYNFEFIRPESMPAAESEKLSLILKQKTSWNLSVGPTTNNINDIILKLNLESKKKGKKEAEGIISGTFKIGIDAIPISCDIFSDQAYFNGTISKIKLSQLISEICGAIAIRDLEMPVAIHAIELSDMSMLIDPKDSSLSFSGKCEIGDVEISIASSGEACDILMAIMPKKSWNISQIYEDSSDYNDIPYSEAFLVASSLDVSSTFSNKFSQDILKQFKKGVQIQKGLNFVASINPADIGLDYVLGLKNSIDIARKISKKSDIDFSIDLEGRYRLDKKLSLSQVRVRILPFQKDVPCILEGLLEAKVGQKQLNFAGIMEVGKDGCTFKSNDEVTWTEPFDIKETEIHNIALNLSMNLKKKALNAEITGDLHLGGLNFPISISMGPDSPEIILAKADKIDLVDLLPAFCDKEKEIYLEKEIRSDELNAEFSNAEIVLAPENVTVGKNAYKKGLQISGDMALQGMNGEGKLEIVYADHMQLSASMEEIKLGDVFSLEAGKGQPSLHISIDAKNQYAAKGDVKATISLLGIKKNVEMQMIDGLFHFEMNEKIFDGFQASLKGKAWDFASPERIFITADLKNDFYNYMQNNAYRILRQSAEGTVSRMKKLDRAVADSEERVKRLSEKGSKLREAKEENRVKEKMDKEESTKKQEDAQRRVKELKQKINSKDKIINQLERNMDRRWRAIENAPWEEQLWRQIEYIDDVEKKTVRVTNLYENIGNLEIRNWNAFKRLEMSKLALRSKRGVDTTLPIDSDPEIKANQVLYEAESKSLKTAIEARELLKQSLSASLDVSTQIVSSKSSELLKISGAHFEGNLAAISGGKVGMSVDVQFADNPIQTFQLDFDFRDSLAGARSLAQMLLPTP